MKIILRSPRHLWMTEFHEPGFQVEPEDPDAHFSAIQMFAASIGLCSYSVLASYAQQLKISEHDLAIEVNWEYAHDPYRISSLRQEIHWPELPASRIQAAQRVVDLCTLHNTLKHSPSLETEIRTHKNLAAS